MANLIKNALIKQLSRFLKNVSPNQINISTFKGEGEMKNIELDENVLMNLIELPTWLNITNARCNKATFKVQWTKLKTSPIIIGLDKIELDMEITESLREPTNSDSKFFETDQNGPYTFIDKCIDAIQLNIDSITITIKSNKFNANMNMSNICVYSCTPNWNVTHDIKNTRLKDLETEEIILFKEISWEICRLEAFILEDSSFSLANNQPPASVKLIMNPSKIQIALKKKLSDKSLITSTVQILLNEIYWMANDTQLKSAIGAYNMISKLMKKTSLQQRKYVPEQKLSTQNTLKPKPSINKPGLENNKNIDESKVFMNYDIKETSLHLKISVLNVHMYADDNYSANCMLDGGAMQILFKNLCIDHYPYHKTSCSMKHWNNFNHIFMLKEEWSKNLINDFMKKLETILKKSNNIFNKIKLKSCLTLFEACTIVTLQDLCVYKVTTNVSDKTASNLQKTKKNTKENIRNNKCPLEFSELLLTKKFFIEQQTYDKRPFLASNFGEFNLPANTLFMHFFFSDFYFPKDCNYPIPCSQVFTHIAPILLNLDYLTLLWVNTLLLSFYHEKLIVDQCRKNEFSNKNDNIENKSNYRSNLHVDIQIEILMSKLVFFLFPQELISHKNLTGIELGVSSICLTNKSLSVSDENVREDLSEACTKVYESSKELCDKQNKFFQNQKINDFNQIDEKLKILSPCFNELRNNQSSAYIRQDISCNNDFKLINITNETNDSKIGLFLKSLNKNVLNKSANKDIWCIDLKSIWIDICSNDSINKNNIIKNTSFILWVVNIYDFYRFDNNNSRNTKTEHKKSDSYYSVQKQKVDQIYIDLSKIIPIDSNNYSVQNQPKNKRSKSLVTECSMIKRQKDSRYLYKDLYSKLNVIGRIEQIRINCNHDQLLFMFRFLETFDLLNEQLEIDSEHILKYNKQTKSKDKKFNSGNIDNNNKNSRNQIESDSSSILNASIIINSILIELEINNYDLQNLDKIITKSSERREVEKKEETSACLEKSNSEFDSNNYNIRNNNPFIFQNDKYKKDTYKTKKQIDTSYLSSYLKFIYGFHQENPTNKLIFTSSQIYDSKSPLIPEENDIIENEILKTMSSLNSSINTNISSSSLSITSSASSSTPYSSIKTHTFPIKTDGYNKETSFEIDTISIASFKNDLTIENNSILNDKQKHLNPVESTFLSADEQQDEQQTSSFQFKSIQDNNHNVDPPCSREYKDSHIQTTQQTIKVKIILNCFQSYTQINSNSRIIAMIKAENIELDNKKSVFMSKKSRNIKETPINQEILIQFRKFKEDPLLKIGLLDLIIEDFVLEFDIPILNGIIDFIDDDGDTSIKMKHSLPANIVIKNSQFVINKFVSTELEKFKNKITIENLWVKKSSINEVSFVENKFNSKRQKQRTYSSNDEIDEMFTKKSIIKSPEQIASLVFLLRKSREEINVLKKELENEKIKSIIIGPKNEDEVELSRTKKLNESQIDIFDKCELERKQFESILKTYEDENEVLKTKLKKAEEMISILKIDRESIIKNLNEQLKYNKR